MLSFRNEYVVLKNVIVIWLHAQTGLVLRYSLLIGELLQIFDLLEELIEQDQRLGSERLI